jgi:CBS domain-containing protein
MIIEDVLAFLRGIPPFQFLEEGDLLKAAGDLSMEFYPKDTVILKQGGLPSSSLRVIKKGAVKVLMGTDTGEDIVLEYKGEGDNFGFLSMIGKDRQKTTVTAVEDTLCYVLDEQRVGKLIESSQAFNEYFMAYLSRYVDRTYQEMHQRNPLYSDSDRLLYTTPVGTIAIPLVSVKESAPIQEAARMMVQHKISSLVIRNDNNVPTGIITDRDLREKVVAKGRNTAEPVKNIGTLSLIRVDGRDICFEALLKMIQFDIHHLLVVEEGELKGIVTNHDLMLLQGTSPVSFAKDILNQETVEGLASLTGKILNIIGLLLKEETKVPHLANVITEIYDRFFRKIMEIGEKKFGPPPLPYCFVVLGSEGRREQIFKTRQDNALIYFDPGTPGLEIDAAGYFTDFGDWVSDSLAVLGLQPGPENVQAANPEWRQPFRAWQKLFQEWIEEATLEKIAESLPFFDSRPLYGKFSLFLTIRDLIAALIKGEGQKLLEVMTAKVVQMPPPVGFVRNHLVEKDGTQHEFLDLAQRGLQPLVDLVRIFALSRGIRETATLSRIQALKDREPGFQKITGELARAFEFMMLLNIHHQFRQVKSGQPTDSLIEPAHLSSSEKKTLREAFRLIARLQALAQQADWGPEKR